MKKRLTAKQAFDIVVTISKNELIDSILDDVRNEAELGNLDMEYFYQSDDPNVCKNIVLYNMLKNQLEVLGYITDVCKNDDDLDVLWICWGAAPTTKLNTKE